MFAPATLVAVEGADRVGKFTQSKLLVEELRRRGAAVLHVEVPIRSRFTYPLIYSMLRSGLAKRLPNVFQFVQFLNKWTFQLLTLSLKRWYYDYVVFDRWSPSAIVYGDATGANRRFNRFLYGLLREPDTTLVIVGPPKSSKATDVYESDTKLQSDVRNGYASWLVQHSDSAVVIDNNGTREQVHERLMDVFDRLSDPW